MSDLSSIFLFILEMLPLALSSISIREYSYSLNSLLNSKPRPTVLTLIFSFLVHRQRLFYILKRAKRWIARISSSKHDYPRKVPRQRINMDVWIWLTIPLPI